MIRFRATNVGAQFFSAQRSPSASAPLDGAASEIVSV